MIIIRKSSLRITFGSVKRLTAIAFIFLLSAQCIFKLTIITYFQANRDYIAEVLCVNKEKPMTMCNGQCFLDRNLSLVDDETPKQVPATTKLSVEAPVFVATDFHIDLHRSSLDIENSSAPQPLYNFYSQRTFFHPPC
jgi:hypothetical protein